MLPSSHQIHIQRTQPPIAGEELAEAFSDFISASARLELSYRELQAEVAELTEALSERNQALSRSLSENRSIGLTLERIIEAMPCGVLVVNAEGAVQLANPEAARLLGLTGPLGAPERPEWGLTLWAGSGIYELADETEQEFSFESAAGAHWIAVRKVSLNGVRRSMSASSPAGGTEAVIMLRDISARKRMEQEREAARDSVALAQVAALLAHEIRNPLASLELFAGLIKDDPERADEWISHLTAGIRSLSGTVNNVLTLQGGTTIALEPIDVVAEAALSVSFLQPLAGQAGVALRLEVAGAEEIWCRSNRSAFQQILLNLCSNALRHTPAEGLVRVVCSVPAFPGGPVRIAVIDTGCGIAEQNLPRLFEPGFSGTGATPGLGLAVCERLIRQHGGAIHVSSRAGHGSTFTMELLQA